MNRQNHCRFQNELYEHGESFPMNKNVKKSFNGYETVAMNFIVEYFMCSLCDI